MCDATTIHEKIELLINSFRSVLYEPDETFLKNMETHNLAGDDICRYQYWEWTQGVGLYGMWQLFTHTGARAYLDILTDYYDARMQVGLPGKNINTMAPILTLTHVAEHTGNEQYLSVCHDWAEWAMHTLPRTQEGGFQHITSDTVNDGELWDDTLFMCVLALARAGVIFDDESYRQEAIYQFLLHTKYLADKRSGLWFHGFTFHGRHNFTKALWGRGNCWVTIAIPILIETLSLPPSVEQFLRQTLKNQVDSLVRFQDSSGMWHTLLDDPTSYLESSATSGIGYGILKAVHLGILDSSYVTAARRALPPILDLIDGDGIVHQVSYGTPMGRESLDFYRTIPLRPMPYGQATAILLLLESLKDSP